MFCNHVRHLIIALCFVFDNGNKNVEKKTKSTELISVEC